MKLMLNPRQERFCILICKGEALTKAYALAGYVTKSNEVAKVNASRLLTHAPVRARIAELQQMAALRTSIDLEFLTRRLLDITDKAEVAMQFAAAKECVALIAKMHGFLVERSEVSISHRPAPLPTAVLELSEQDWLRQFSRADQKLQHLENAPSHK